MKPIKLTMTAFGPYKDQEVIQFTDLNAHKLFVISGKTGAGKTTVFDAICFALYGTASGEDRGEARMLRSHFADEQVHTSVEFEFELQSKRYRIFRQMPHIKKGNKSATGDKYEFYQQLEDKEIPCVDRQMVSEINQKVKDLIGLSEDQFKQIVMLPQGEFRKLLTSETDNKELILRKIFKTEPYLWFSNKMNEKRIKAEKAYKEAHMYLKQQVSHIRESIPEREGSRLKEVFEQGEWLPQQIIKGLEDENVYYKKELDLSKKAFDRAKKAYDEKYKAYYQAEATNQQFDQLKEKEAEHQALNAQKEEMNEKRELWKQAERAATLSAYETQKCEAYSDEQAQTQTVETSKKVLEQTKNRLSQAEKKYADEQKKEEDRHKTTQDLNRYKELLPIVEAADRKKRKLDEFEKAIKEQENVLNSTKEKETALSDEIDHLNAELSKLDEVPEKLFEKKEKLNKMTEKGKTFRQYIDGTKEIQTLTSEVEQAKALYKKEKNHFKSIEDSWIKGQATVLARQLHDEEPCPVCGSMSHPNKAIHHDRVPSQEAFDQAKDAVNNTYEVYIKKNTDLKGKHEEIEKLRETLSEFQFSTDEEASLLFNQYLAEAKALGQSVKDLEKESEKLKSTRKEKEEKERELKALNETLEKQKADLQTANVNFASLKSEYESELSRLPEEHQTLSGLNQAIEQLEKKKQQLDAAWELAQKELTDAKQEQVTKETELNAAKQQLKERKDRYERAMTQFNDALKEAGFRSEEAYQEAFMSKEERDQLKDEVDRFDSRLSTLDQQITELKDKLKNKQELDLVAMSEALVVLERSKEEAYQKQTQTRQFVDQTKQMMRSLTEMVEEIKQKEHTVNVITDLYDVIRGQNDRKISFERYVQIEFLEQIIVAANERLNRVSNGQFHLVRSDRQESRGKQSGLSLDVYDAYTGQNRDVKTMSGGEKFNASLSLALGMSDVIQSYQGGVKIDTMFIDEGFGSLDEESLQNVIDTLIDLQKSGRTVGVISHVQEMKNVFPAILEVKKTLEGYSETTFIVK
ncbi:exonuclease SbcC [Pelagirhabdus alkalitolerans]|uniref:Nuclease SbcCD subunit C n=1 Tax=Pelagirhabdus alkalitolerans TaxID=1612202 RepID=A0A1G6MQM9_9BACI|nr:SMC family ATPase [Pelagirhabdus alkalitolerans]SDC57812.1 exonuclease SbcC [Pelagirhabdus alkalitolerans]